MHHQRSEPAGPTFGRHARTAAVRREDSIAPSWYTALPVAVAMIPRAGMRATLTWAAQGIAHVEYTDSLRAAEQLVFDHDAIALFSLRRDAEGVHAVDVFRRVRKARPHVATALVDPAGIVSHASAAFVAAHERVIREDSVHVRSDIAAMLRDAARAGRRRMMARELCASIGTSAQSAVRIAIERGEQPLSIRQLAAAVGVPRKTLDRWLCRTSRLTARQLLGWGRLIAVAMRLEDDAVTVTTISNDLRFASPSALRNLLQRYVGMTPTQLREAGGADYLYAQLRNELAVSPNAPSDTPSAPSSAPSVDAPPIP